MLAGVLSFPGGGAPRGTLNVQSVLSVILEPTPEVRDARSDRGRPDRPGPTEDAWTRGHGASGQAADRRAEGLRGRRLPGTPRLRRRRPPRPRPVRAHGPDGRGRV